MYMYIYKLLFAYRPPIAVLLGLRGFSENELGVALYLYMHIYMCVCVYMRIYTDTYMGPFLRIGVRGLLGPKRIGCRTPMLARRSFGGANLPARRGRWASAVAWLANGPAARADVIPCWGEPGGLDY